MKLSVAQGPDFHVLARNAILGDTMWKVPYKVTAAAFRQ
jgi:hypothetical protein